MKFKTVKALSASIVLSTSLLTGTVHAGLIDRGNGMIYDDVLDITWLQNANSAGSKMNWSDSVAWADSLKYGGFEDWRLTKTYDVGNDGCNFSSSGGTDCGFNVLTSYTDGSGNTFFSELAYMFYVNLSNVAYNDTSGNGPQTGWDTLNSNFKDAVTGDTVSFDNLFRSYYWSGTEVVNSTGQAWGFRFQNGEQYNAGKNDRDYVWAVRDGDVVTAAKVPEPTSIAIFGLGLFGLALRQRQRR